MGDESWSTSNSRRSVPKWAVQSVPTDESTTMARGTGAKQAAVSTRGHTVLDASGVTTGKLAKYPPVPDVTPSDN
eukprot:1392169-Amorphochlora_amoeboformis.AAC.3